MQAVRVKMKRWIVSILSICLIASVGVVTYASSKEETVNDLFALYNEAQLDDLMELQNEYEALLKQLESAETEVALQEIYNDILEDTIKWKEAEERKLNDEIQQKIKENEDISKEISEKITGDWDTLVALDSKYKTNQAVINHLLEKKSKYSVTSMKKIDYDSLDQLSKEVEDLKDVYKEAVDVRVLGVVHGVKFPLGADTVITSKFGDRVDPMTGKSIRFHAGLDLRASVGTPVLSLFNGVVTDTGYGVAGGNYVKVDHGNGVMTYYCHLSEITCQKGQVVNQYDQIALSGNTGTRTTGPHLHLGVYINGNPVDPEVLFK